MPCTAGECPSVLTPPRAPFHEGSQSPPANKPVGEEAGTGPSFSVTGAPGCCFIYARGGFGVGGFISGCKCTTGLREHALGVPGGGIRVRSVLLHLAKRCGGASCPEAGVSRASFIPFLLAPLSSFQPQALGAGAARERHRQGKPTGVARS